jgi:hypothetical protein
MRAREPVTCPRWLVGIKDGTRRDYMRGMGSGPSHPLKSPSHVQASMQPHDFHAAEFRSAHATFSNCGPCEKAFNLLSPFLVLGTYLGFCSAYISILVNTL